ncbi:DEKNAAC103456 [Brettanomyces naardenensis]|uniref:DEKNAAC103456 n=1 Tax=Brettanomyces naardenensis TaxID=13370 RepID=A0A448YNG5_BRENA|nr:DEKNAAC103456 [Brettanomyces naardenensis]
MEFQNTKLYGGALTADLPVGLFDASQLRQIPNTQEVYVCETPGILNKFDALIIDLLERVDVDDSEAIQYHLNEICKLNEVDKQDSVILGQDKNAKADNLPNDYCAWVISGEQAKKWGRDETPLVLFLALIRLENVKTDLLISYNIPFHDQLQIDDLRRELQGDTTADNLAVKRIDVGKQVVLRILKSLKIHDWSLFKN